MWFLPQVGEEESTIWLVNGKGWWFFKRSVSVYGLPDVIPCMKYSLKGFDNDIQYSIIHYN